MLGKLQENRIDVIFMNLGIVLKDNKHPINLRPEHEKERLQFQFYHYLIDELDIENKDLLELGCGTGGGCFYYATYFQPKSITGIDLLKKNIQLADQRFRNLGINFFCADACSLSMEDSSIDIVFNLESSHSYSDFPQFLDKVYHVLKPGGFFSFSDIRYEKDYENLKTQLLKKGFIIEKEENISKHVCEALIRDNDRKMDLIGKKWIRRKIFSNLGFLKNSKNYRMLMSGETRYFYFLLKKPNDL